MAITSLYDYQHAIRIGIADEPFYALIMAAMLRADTDNTARLRAAFPQVWDELDERYHTPGGLLRDEMCDGNYELVCPEEFEGDD